MCVCLGWCVGMVSPFEKQKCKQCKNLVLSQLLTSCAQSNHVPLPPTEPSPSTFTVQIDRPQHLFSYVSGQCSRRVDHASHTSSVCNEIVCTFNSYTSGSLERHQHTQPKTQSRGRGSTLYLLRPFLLRAFVFRKPEKVIIILGETDIQCDTELMADDDIL